MKINNLKNHYIKENILKQLTKLKCEISVKRNNLIHQYVHLKGQLLKLQYQIWTKNLCCPATGLFTLVATIVRKS